MHPLPNEVVVRFMPNLLRWEGKSAGFFLFGTKYGMLVVTTERLLFLSTGQSGITGQFNVISDAFSGKNVSVRDIDLSALGNEGSLNVPLSEVESMTVHRRWDFASYISLRLRSHTGDVREFAFMSKVGLNRNSMLGIAEACGHAKMQQAARTGAAG